MSLVNIKSHCSFAPSKKKEHINKNNYSDVSLRSKNDKQKEMPIYASLKKASYTIEAAVVIPLFITMMVFGIFLFRLLQVQSGMQQSIDYASRTMAVTLGNVSNTGESDKDVTPDSKEATIKGELSHAALLASTIGLAGYQVAQNDVPLEFIDGGAAGIDFLESSAEGNYIDLKVNYKMTFPVGLFGNLKFDVSQRARNRKWIGYEKAENETDGQYVYITEHGEVYHTNYYCTYLNPSVHRIEKSEVSSKRNKSGAIYYKCKRCRGVKEGGFLYITDYGTSYHSDVNCTEIKHDIKKVLLADIKDKMRPCSKCAAGQAH